MAGRKGPQITVLMISYNGAKLIDGAVESLLRQTDRKFEVVMLDDHSGDNTHAKMLEAQKKFAKIGVRCRVFSNERNRGTGYGWNRTAQLAETPWVLFLADDDEYMAGKVAATKKFIAANPDAEWFYHDVVIEKEASGERRDYDVPDFNAGRNSLGNFFALALKNQFIPHIGVAVRKDVLEGTGGFRELRGVEDFDMWWRLIAAGHVPRKMRGPPLALYRSRGLDSSRFAYQGYYGSFTQSVNDFLARKGNADPAAVALAREFRAGVYLAYFMRCARRGNFPLALKVLGGMVRRDFSPVQFARMAGVKFARIFRGEN